MTQFQKAALYRMLGPLGLVLALLVPLPVSLATLSTIEPLLFVILLSAWFTGYYLRARLLRDAGAMESTPVFRRLFGPDHSAFADSLKFLVLFLSLLFAWTVWSSQPVRIFNATILGTIWAVVDLTGVLMNRR